MTVSKAKIEADARYDKKTYDHFLVKVRKNAGLTLGMIKEHASVQCESTNSFILRAIKATMRNLASWFLKLNILNALL